MSDLNIRQTNIFIYSDHFSIEDFRYKPQGQGIQQCLMPGAVPKYSTVTEVPPVSAVLDQTSKTVEPTSGDTLPSSSGADMWESPLNGISEVSPTKSTDVVRHVFNTSSPVRKRKQLLLEECNQGKTLRFSKEDEKNAEAPVNLKLQIHSVVVEESLSYPSTSKVERIYAGDLDSDDFTSPTRAKRSWRVAKTTISRLKANVNSLQKSRNYYRNRVTSLQRLLSYLESRNLISTGAKQHIQECLPEGMKHLISRLLQGPKKMKYGPELRSFAMTLHFYSPKAYQYVRKI
ncbi:unnamed protein product [Callosobruchus maculatus]|uniref:THAP9-like helix-turn-helix domain-containing protein n=1 Tax=Callosobruchus maculatus TaxID=64391 RepID=A0A653C168_CALMS|nr:unnamed protein product [Callosobruchus maculatus]